MGRRCSDGMHVFISKPQPQLDSESERFMATLCHWLPSGGCLFEPGCRAWHTPCTHLRRLRSVAGWLSNLLTGLFGCCCHRDYLWWQLQRALLIWVDDVTRVILDSLDWV